jgi:predicted secreted acid phosphatase
MNRIVRIALSAVLISSANSIPAQNSAQPAFSTDAAAERIPNLDTLKAELKQYHDCTCTCGCYAHDLDRQADAAIAFLRRRAAHKRAGEKLALVLDIDETTLSNYPQLLKEDFAYNKDAFDAWVQSAFTRKPSGSA